MRILGMLFASLLLGGVMAAQTPVASRAQAGAPKPAQGPRPSLMRHRPRRTWAGPSPR